MHTLAADVVRLALAASPSLRPLEIGLTSLLSLKLASVTFEARPGYLPPVVPDHRP